MVSDSLSPVILKEKGSSTTIIRTRIWTNVTSLTEPQPETHTEHKNQLTANADMVDAWLKKTFGLLPAPRRAGYDTQ